MTGKEIVTCVINSHPIYDDNFKRNNIKIGKSYKCIGEIVLTSDSYYIPEFSALKGITIRSHVDRWGWAQPCLPKECFRPATASELKKYKINLVLNFPLRFVKIRFFKFIRKIDRIIRRRRYKNEDYLF